MTVISSKIFKFLYKIHAQTSKFGVFDKLTLAQDWLKTANFPVVIRTSENSSQGGKLSFWNCRLTKDDKTFIIGIATNLLLNVLKNNTFIDGKCQSPLMFARCKGGVGILSENMESYKTKTKECIEYLKRNLNFGV